MLWIVLLCVTVSAVPCDIRNYGAVGDGVTLNTKAINQALARCDDVVITGVGLVFMTGSLHLRSHQRLSVNKGTTLLGAPNDVDAYDLPEPNKFDVWQDFGHSHWHNALMWGVGLTNVTITGGPDGGGLIDGGGLSGGDPPLGGGDKTISLKNCSHVTISGDLYFRNTGHFALLATDVQYLTLTHLTIEAHRDGLDLVGVQHVWAQYLRIFHGGDDAFVLKSDYSTGRAIDVHNVTCRDSTISTNGTTALEIGSETTGDFYDIHFANIRILSSGDTGIGIATMDGSNVHDVTYDNITMSGVTSPFQFVIGARLLRPYHAGVQPGSIRRVTARNITAFDMLDPLRDGGRNWTATLDGQPRNDSHHANRTFPVGPDINLERVTLRYRGGGLSTDVNQDPPHPYNHWFKIGTRPSWGWFLRNTYGVTFTDLRLELNKSDGRPAVIVESGHDVVFDNLQAVRGDGLSYDIGVREGGHVVVRNSPGVVVRNISSP